MRFAPGATYTSIPGSSCVFSETVKLPLSTRILKLYGIGKLNSLVLILVPATVKVIALILTVPAKFSVFCPMYAELAFEGCFAAS